MAAPLTDADKITAAVERLKAERDRALSDLAHARMDNRWLHKIIAELRGERGSP